MALVLYHHPFSRAANSIWVLEELEQPYELRYVDLMAGAQKKPDILALNPMGKLPILVDGDEVVTEGAAIALYLADRYAYGRLAPRVDDPARGTYLRWSFFAPSVIEPGAMAKAAGWPVKEGQAGWGSFDAMVSAMERAVADRQRRLRRDRTLHAQVQDARAAPRPRRVCRAARRAPRATASRRAQCRDQRGARAQSTLSLRRCATLRLRRQRPQLVLDCLEQQQQSPLGPVADAVLDRVP
jgi:glutathione S-transferase